MRLFLIACVLVIAAGTFYSALWFKSESIETDIRTRVADRLADGDGAAVEVDVDGRQVVLSGIVPGEAEEAAFLETAGDTFGALGPIDGLSVQPSGGYLSALKTPEGIILRGTVPSADARAALISQAQGATDGPVDDRLVIAGSTADWQDEAGFGLGLLAGLKGGTVTVAPENFLLSGIAEGDMAQVTDALADRAGWQAFVSSSGVEQQLSGDVAALAQELDVLRERLAEDEAATEALRRQLSRSQEEMSLAEAAVQDRDRSVAALTSDVAALTDELAAAERLVTGADAMIAALSANLSAGGTDVDALTRRIGFLEAEVAAVEAALGEADQQIPGLQDEVAALGQQVARLEVEVAERDGTIADLTDQVAAQQVEIAVRETNLAEAEATWSEMIGQVSSLTSQIAALEAEIADAEEGRRIEVLALSDDVVSRDAVIAELSGDLRQAEEELARVKVALETQSAQTATPVAQALTLPEPDVRPDGADGVLDVQIAVLQDDVAVLTQTVAARDATIAELRSQTGVNADLAQICAARTSSALDSGQIRFDRAVLQFTRESVALLERLTGIALACVGDGLTFEIGGHADSFGTEEVNQELSDARARFVVDFMIARGVPAEAVTAVGYGESRPVADNATAAGRAENRRITFDWRMP